MKTFTILSLAAGAAATFKGANPFECPINTDNKCKPKQNGGFNWDDLNPGKFGNYHDFDFKGWECREDKSFTRRGHFDRRTFGKVIDARASSSKGDCPSFNSKDKFSLDTFHLSTEFDCDLEFHYGMPDGSTCRHRAPCKKGGSKVKNTQCGGAKDVTIVYPPQPNKPKKDCGITVTSIEFDCSSRPPKPTSSIRTTSQPPKVTTTNQPPRPTTTNRPPQGPGSSSQPPRPTTTSVVPGSSSQPPAGTTSRPPQGPGSSSQPPRPTTTSVSGSSSRPPQVPVSSSRPPVGSSSQPPQVPVSSSRPPVGSSSRPPVASSSQPPQVPVSSSRPPVGSSSRPPVSSSSQPPRPTTTSRPPAATTSVTSTLTTVRPSTSTFFTTRVSTVFTCADNVKDCPGRSTTAIVTVSVPVSTTVTQVTEVKTTTLPPVNVPGTTVTVPGPVVTLPCPEVVPKCLNTWIFQLGCKDNTDTNCYCPDAAFVENVFQCFYAHGESDKVISEAVVYFQGICAPHIPKNPAIVTGPTITSYITVTAPPTPIATNPAAITTILVTKTTVIPSTDAAGKPNTSAGSTLTVQTSIVVPKLGFATAPAVPGATGPAAGGDVIGLVPITTALPIVTGAAPRPSGSRPTGGAGSVPGGPVGTGVRPRPTSPGNVPVKAAGERVYASLALAVMAVVVAL